MSRNQLLWIVAAVVAVIIIVWIFMANQRPATTANAPPATTEAPATTTAPATNAAPAAGTETPPAN